MWALNVLSFKKSFLISEVISYIHWLVCVSGVLSFFSLTILVIRLLKGNKFSLSCLVFFFWMFLILCEGMLWCICVRVFNFFLIFFLLSEMGVCFVWTWNYVSLRRRVFVFNGYDSLHNYMFYWIQVSTVSGFQRTFVW